MSNKELKELMSIICEGQDSEQRRKVENFIEYQVQLIDSLDKEIERLNNILDTLMQDMAILNGCGKREIKPKYIFDRIARLRGDDKDEKTNRQRNKNI